MTSTMEFQLCSAGQFSILLRTIFSKAQIASHMGRFIRWTKIGRSIIDTVYVELSNIGLCIHQFGIPCLPPAGAA